MNFITQNLGKFSLCYIVSTLTLNSILTANNVKEAEYVWPIDEDNVIPLPIASLRGKLIQHTFPGPPNYESIQDGDFPETRWVLEISEKEIQKLVTSNYVPKDMYQFSKEDWVQVISPGTEQTPKPLLNKKVVVTGCLGTLRTHRHTYITIEAKDIYEE
jgi:hypothetical protein